MTDRFPGGLLVSEAREDSAVLGGARDGLGDLLAGWRAVGFAGYVVRFDASWECWAADYGAAGVVVLGVAMDVEHPELGTAAVAAGLARALATSRQRFFEALDALCGAHLVFARDGSGSPLVVQDATGMEGLCYDVGGGPRLLASHPALIAELRGYELSEMARQWLALPVVRAGNFYFPGLRTPYEQVRILTPNTCLHLDSLEVQRFFPREPLAELDRGEIVERVAPLLRDQFPWLVARYPLAVSLTGGLDTRLTLAATRDLHDQLSYRLTAEGLHGEIAGRLAAMLGLPSGQSPPAVGRLGICSDVLATVRGLYLENPANHPDILDARRLSRLFCPATAEPFEPYFEEFCEVTGLTAEAKGNLHFTDLFCWEHRLGAWHGGAIRDRKAHERTYAPYNCRRILTLMLRRPLAERAGAVVVYSLIDRLWSDVLDVPIARSVSTMTRLSTARRETVAAHERAATLRGQLEELEHHHAGLAQRVRRMERALAARQRGLARRRLGTARWLWRSSGVAGRAARWLWHSSGAAARWG